MIIVGLLSAGSATLLGERIQKTEKRGPSVRKAYIQDYEFWGNAEYPKRVILKAVDLFLLNSLKNLSLSLYNGKQGRDPSLRKAFVQDDSMGIVLILMT